MSGNFQVLGSSSAGNAGLLRTEHSKILVDAGFSARQLELMLAKCGESIESIDAVFLTHEHTDHSAGIRGLSRRADLPVFCNRQTAEAVQAKLKSRPKWHLFETGSEFTFRDLTVRAFAVPHDAYDPVGFTFHWGDDDLFSRRSGLAWVTDLGYIPELVRQHVETVDLLFVETNYDEAMLESDTRRPWSTKQRIRSRHGHLSNKDCLAFVESIHAKSPLRHVCLGHLSRDCNALELVRELFRPLIEREKRFSLEVVDPAMGSDSCFTF